MSHHHYHHHDDASGERFVPEAMAGQFIEAEHHARYRFALDHVRGRRVLDAGCGVGWGSALLKAAGAVEVVGLDISDEALADARERAPECEFVLGDLQDLPFEDGRFDVVVCFEALEHAEDTGSTLDGLVRVLAEDGLVFVSSPNPAVYPDGNPFHIHELTPQELAREMAARLDSSRLFLQHQLAASLVCEASLSEPGEHPPFPATTLSITGLGPGDDHYSVVVASRRELPELAAWNVLTTPAELKALTAERADVLAQLEAAHQQLRDADAALRSVMQERDEAIQRAVDLASQWEAANLQLRNQEAVATNAARERDDLAVRLVDAQQRHAASEQEQSARIEMLRGRLRKRRKELRRARARIKGLRGSAAPAPSLARRVRRRLGALGRRR